MELLVLASVFVLCNVMLHLWAKNQLSKENNSIDTMFVRGTVRGCEGRFDTSGNLELMRKRVNRKKSKF
jgi:hypothetical protein